MTESLSDEEIENRDDMNYTTRIISNYSMATAMTEKESASPNVNNYKLMYHHTPLSNISINDMSNVGDESCSVLMI